jgi:hypothetical protein
VKIEIEPAKWAAAATEEARHQHTAVILETSDSVCAVVRVTDFNLIHYWTWGFAALHPRLYAGTRSAG